MRFLCLVSVLAWTRVDARCETGVLYQGRGTPASTNLANAKECQKLCSENEYCTHFSYDLGDCWFLRDSSALQTKATAVSGASHCVMSGDLVQTDTETEEERSQRIHEMIVKIAGYVEEHSLNLDTVAKAGHLKWSAENGFLKEEGYEKIASVLNSASMLFTADGDPAGLVRAASKGMIGTRDDLDWILKHCTGEGPVSEGLPEQALPVGGDTPCNNLRGCDTGSSFGAGTPWANAEVKYCFDVRIASSAREGTECAITKIKQALPGIRFTNVGTSGNGACATSPAIFIQSSDRGCWANIGMARSFFGFSSEQKLNLQTPGCDDCGTAIHEMLHSMGVAHEQSRPDRDQYIVINWQNIQSGMAPQFAVDQKADINRPYDILSIMHYGSTAFTRNGQPTISVKPQGYQLYTTNPNEYRFYRSGQRMSMSQRDIDQLADLYDCVTPSSCGGVVGPDPTDPSQPDPTPNPFGPIIPTFPPLPTDFNLTGDQITALFAAVVAGCVICAALSCFCSGGGSQYRYIR